MSQPTILTVEDDAAIRQGIVDALTYSGYEVIETGDGLEALKMAITRSYDLLLLDLVLPGMSGLEILKQLRETRPAHPVIILTALGGESDRVEGLKLGADDYVVKPFSVKELLARVEAVLRRSASRPSDVLQLSVPGGTADLARQEIVFEDGKRIDLSSREIELLRYLAINSGRAISRDEILANVWRISPRGVSTRTIDMHVARLREKLRDNPDSPEVIVTVRGKGYMYGCSENRA
jgi:DNA-binding response OmpR family regulator